MKPMGQDSTSTRRGHGRTAFTLIELLASIAILAMIVTIMSTIFAESDRAWKVGTGRAEANNEARAAVTAIADDLQYAIADKHLRFLMRPDIYRARPSGVLAADWPVKSYGYTNSEICFVSMQGDANPRSTRALYYWVRQKTDTDAFTGTPLGRYELVRTEIRTDDPLGAYLNTNWVDEVGGSPGGRHTAQGMGVIAENIAALSFYAPGPAGNLTNFYDSVAANSIIPGVTNRHRLPEYVDIMIEVLTDDDAQRCSDLRRRFPDRSGSPSVEVARFVERNARRYTSRVYFQNRAGYLERW